MLVSDLLVRFSLHEAEMRSDTILPTYLLPVSRAHAAWSMSRLEDKQDLEDYLPHRADGSRTVARFRPYAEGSQK